MWDRLHNSLLILIMKNKTFGITCCLGWKKEGLRKFWKIWVYMRMLLWSSLSRKHPIRSKLWLRESCRVEGVGLNHRQMHFLPRRSELPSNTWPHRTVLIVSPFPAPTAHHLRVLWLRPNSSGLLALFPLTNVPSKHCIAYLKIFISVSSARSLL